MAGGTSIETGEKRNFSTPDYVVFVILIVINAGVGLFYAIKDRAQKKENNDEYLLGGRSMSIIPVALSLTVTFLSSSTLLGTPVEMYNYHTMFIYMSLGVIIATVTSALVFIPFFYRLQVTSTFQYLEMRFNYVVRILGSAVLIIQTLLYMAIVLYAPSLALSSVTKLNFEGTVVGVGLVVTFYTTLGGMKAVVWTDTFQSLVIFAGLLAVFIQGCIEADGFPNAWELADNRSRIVMDDFSFDPGTRHSFWSVVVGGGFFWMSLYGVNQAQVQRCLSTKNVESARLAIAVSTPPLILLNIFSCLIGIVMFAYYANCDPYKAGLIEKKDQLLPLYVMDILGHLQGIPGMFVACIFSGSLSTLSSGLNAISAIVYKDFLQTCCCKNISDFHMNIINKVLAAVFGGIMIGLVFLVAELGTLQETSMTVYGIMNGPIFGLFVLGIFFPWANAWGAIVGFLTSLAFMAWIGIGAYVHKIRTATPSPVSIEQCLWLMNNTSATTMATTTANVTISTLMENSTAAAADSGYEGVDKIYTLSYLYYTPTGMCFTVVMGLIVSFITGYTRPSTLDSRLVSPIISCCVKTRNLDKYFDDLELGEPEKKNGNKEDPKSIFSSKKGQYNVAYKP